MDESSSRTTATTAFNMAPVVSQYVGLKFIPGTGHVAINTRTLDKVGDRLRDDIMESGYQAQRAVM